MRRVATLGGDPMAEQDRDYHANRASEELARAEDASSDEAQRSHRRLSELHADLARDPHDESAVSSDH